MAAGASVFRPRARHTRSAFRRLSRPALRVLERLESRRRVASRGLHERLEPESGIWSLDQGWRELVGTKGHGGDLWSLRMACRCVWREGLHLRTSLAGTQARGG